MSEKNYLTISTAGSKDNAAAPADLKCYVGDRELAGVTDIDIKKIFADGGFIEAVITVQVKLGR